MAVDFTLTGSVVYRTPGIKDTLGQDYVRCEGPQGVIEIHPAYNSTTVFGVGSNITARVASASIGIGTNYSDLFSNVVCATVTTGTGTWNDVVCLGGTNSVVLHTIPANTGSISQTLVLNVGVNVYNTTTRNITATCRIA